MNVGVKQFVWWFYFHVSVRLNCLGVLL